MGGGSLACVVALRRTLTSQYRPRLARRASTSLVASGESQAATKGVVCSTARRAGYATALFGKWHLGNLLAGRPGAAAEPFGHSDPGQHGFHDWLVTASVRPCGMI